MGYCPCDFPANIVDIPYMRYYYRLLFFKSVPTSHIEQSPLTGRYACLSWYDLRLTADNFAASGLCFMFLILHFINLGTIRDPCS